MWNCEVASYSTTNKQSTSIHTHDCGEIGSYAQYYVFNSIIIDGAHWRLILQIYYVKWNSDMPE